MFIAALVLIVVVVIGNRVAVRYGWDFLAEVLSTTALVGGILLLIGIGGK